MSSDKTIKKENPFWNNVKSFFHKIGYSTVVVSVDKNKKPTKTIEKPRPIKKWLAFIVFAGVLGVCCWFIFKETDTSKFRLDLIGDIISQLFVPSKWSLKTYDNWWNYLFFTACPKIWSTIEMVFIATVIGSVLAVPFYLLAANNVVRNKPVNFIVRFIINVIRTLPTLVLAVIGAVFYGYSDTAGVFAMSVFTFGIIFKLMYEFVETVDMNPFEVALSNGATRLQGYITSVHPSVMPMYLSNVIYTFEINIRASVVLGFVGAGGIGQLLSDAMEATNYDRIGAILIPLFIVVMALQLLSSYLRRKIS